MINLLKRIWIICFTKNPYRIVEYTRLTARPIDEALDVAENFDKVLLNETGAMQVYPTYPDENTQIIERFVDDRKRYLISGIFKEPDRLLYSLSGACVFGQLGLIYLPEKRAFVSESAKEWLVSLRQSPFTNVVNLPAQTSLKGVTLSCLTNGADAGFYHFIFESIVKVKFAEKIIPHVDFLLFNGPSNEWKLNWLKRAGVDLNKVIWVESTGHYKCEQLLFTSRLITDQQISTWCINALKAIFSVPAVDPKSYTEPKVFFISRKDFVRNIEWEDAILEQYPFIERIDFSKLNPEETIDKMTQATHIIGAHGAALGNIFLCKPGTRVLEIYPDGKSYQPCYYRICAVCRLDYAVTYLNFKEKDHPEGGLNKFEALMKTFFANVI